MKKIIPSLFLVFSLLLTCNADANQITFDAVTGTETYKNGLNAMTDGIFPDETTRWSKNSTWWMGTDPQYTFYFDAAYSLCDIALSVDNNDDYLVEYTTDGIDWHTLFTIEKADGEITSGQGGFDIMSSIAGDDEYLSALDFDTVIATAIRASAAGGDGHYAISEIQAFGMPVPEPATMALFGLGLLGMAGVMRKKKPHDKV